MSTNSIEYGNYSYGKNNFLMRFFVGLLHGLFEPKINEQRKIELAYVENLKQVKAYTHEVI